MGRKATTTLMKVATIHYSKGKREYLFTGRGVKEISTLLQRRNIVIKTSNDLCASLPNN